MTILPFNATSLRLAQTYIAQGKLIGFPTETVYALAADATNNTAISAIYAAKQRDEGKPLSLLVKSVAQIRALCDVPPLAEMLLRAYAPGPITLVLPLKPGHSLSPLLNAGMKTIGVRIPNHPIALAILQATSVPLVGTSANISGEAEALCAESMVQNLGDAISLVIDGGKSPLGIASTVVEITNGTFKLLRDGSISQEEIAGYIQKNLAI